MAMARHALLVVVAAVVLVQRPSCVHGAGPWHRSDWVPGQPPPPPVLPPPLPVKCDIGCGATANSLPYTCAAQQIVPARTSTLHGNGSTSNIGGGAAVGLACSEVDLTDSSTVTVDCSSAGTPTVIGCFMLASAGRVAGSCSSCTPIRDGDDCVAYVPAAIGAACLGRPSCELTISNGGRSVAAQGGGSAAFVNASGQVLGDGALPCAGSRLIVLAYCSTANATAEAVCSPAKRSRALGVASGTLLVLSMLPVLLSAV